MQIVSSGGNLHEMAKTVFWEELKTYFSILYAERISHASMLNVQRVDQHKKFTILTENDVLADSLEPDQTSF